MSTSFDYLSQNDAFQQIACSNEMGLPRRAIKRLIACRKLSVDKEGVDSKCTALQIAQVNMAIHIFFGTAFRLHYTPGSLTRSSRRGAFDSFF
ncbi:hypothetical protein AVEN_88262-1 [Araneus ventricosus]|uniref:Uncharacterized protein n=1 Tax=Araneus ventricosus TaxID=182803 RepID=A0A4Y2EQ48_ARAVE|nr:hypothetical protein AVEN_88262-1 [Araneus ventricosus]